MLSKQCTYTALYMHVFTGEEEWYTAEEGQYSEELGTYVICDVGEGAFKDVTCEGKVESDGETDGQEGIVSATKLKMSFIIPKVLRECIRMLCV